jgi:hypothetical protein
VKARIVYVTLALALAFSLAAVVVPASPAMAASTALQDGGSRLVAMQQNDGGWDWELYDGDPNNPSPKNTIGPIGKGLAEVYKDTGDGDMLTALGGVATFLQAKTNYFSPPDGYLAAELDSILGGSTNVDFVNANYYGPLAAGTYNHKGEGTPYNTAGYLNYIHNRRAGASPPIPNLAAWDIGMGLVGAASAGVTGSELAIWVQAVKDEIDSLDGSGPCDVIGLAGAVYGLAFVGEDFDPTAGEHEAASNLNDLADILASYQVSESGGFSGSSLHVDPGEEWVQETAYAILALAEVGGYNSETYSAARYLESVQLGTGGWQNSAGEPGENNEMTAEALWGIAVAPTEEGGEGGCFIATAAYGTASAAEIDVLRAFRDDVLLESAVGSQLVDWYYQTSPPVADFISGNSLLRTIVRELVIDPIVSVATFTQDIWGK